MFRMRCSRAIGECTFSSGCVVYGTGFYYPPYYWWGPYPYPYYYPYAFYGYGYAYRYNPYTGAYGHGSFVYRPYGGYGRWAGYNPSTGRYAYGGGAYGPYGATRWGSTYNPRTGVSSAGYRSTNYEEAWGERVVRRGDDWVHTGFYANDQGVVRAGRTSEGGKFVGANTENGQGFVGKDKNNNIYAGHDGNVYKKDENGNWYKRENGGWEQTTPPAVPAEKKAQAQSRAAESGVTRESAQNRAQSSGSGTGTRPETPVAKQTGTGGMSAGAQDFHLQASQQRATVQPDVQNSLNRDSAARQQGQTRTRQYESMSRSTGSRTSSASRPRTGGGARRR